ncbi:bifunctional diguanylate cyclase/phosphodiesterase [Oryzomonas sagensis]|uniref:Bifunctional diguanylate cyclase/phosphodiesterase n=1 Tax=Oryzomonas sagensis TaxID=2603857 RepID=A0ABQ6TPD6_9BACT|nr:bifunctional diguanylate cyclase/phosphodiesterase [Oryzomonas sagensis]KAB0670145.1 bifunctional diguanylate cyclase/phosphodiesterase [Oryzomonas sagensis]
MKNKPSSPITLKRFIVIASLAVSSITFLIVLAVSSYIYKKHLESSLTRLSGSISQQIFSSIHQGMERGWTRIDIDLFLTQFRRAFPETFTAAVFRSEAINRQYGTPSSEITDSGAQRVFAKGTPHSRRDGDLISQYYPFKAEEQCRTCHLTARAGEVLGVVRVTEDFRAMRQKAMHDIFVIFALFSPFPLVMSFLVAGYVNRRIGAAVDLLSHKVQTVNRVTDLTTLELGNQHTGFAELDNIFGEFGKIVERIRKVAVGKEMLEFEIQVLERFIITSESIKDWKERVAYLLTEVGKVMQVYTMFCIFQVDDEIFDIEIFWKHPPTAETKGIMEEIIRGRIKEEHIKIDMPASIKVVHNIVGSQDAPLHLDRAAIELQTKSLLLKAPQIGGVVGIGFQSKMATDPIRSLVIDSILTTMLNVVGSIKAIYKYTKDLEYYATRDPLTNLYNQRVFWELLGYEVGRAERHDYSFGLLLIDLDNFKCVNDTHGHLFGDKFLTKVGATIHECLRKGDILARYGGDEFTVAIVEADKEQVYMVANRIREALEEMAVVSAEGITVRGTASIGMAIYPIHAQNEKDLFIFADNMTYKAKNSGKNRLVVPTEDDVIEVFKKSGELSRTLIKAVDEKRITPYFQPIVATSDGAVICHEVLCRIEIGGEVLPAVEFIEMAEALGIISKLDYILMEKVFQKVRAERHEGILFINLSPKSLILNEFIPTIIRLTRTYGIDHEKIVFELTERETVKNMTLLERFVEELKLEGFKFAIDDFGSGFSSFQYIRRLPVDFVKIEGVFVRNMLHDPKDMAFVKTLAVLAKEFGIQSVAEYIENEELFEAVRKMGIDYAQGYHTGMPMPGFAEPSRIV